MKPKPTIVSQTSAGSDDFMKPVSSRPLSSSPTPAVSKLVTPSAPSPATKESKITSTPDTSASARSPPTAPLPKVSGGIFRSNGNHTIFGNKNNTPNSSTTTSSSTTSLFTFMRIWDTFTLPEQRWAFIQISRKFQFNLFCLYSHLFSNTNVFIANYSDFPTCHL